MKQGISISELAREVERREEAMRDFILPSNQIEAYVGSDNKASMVFNNEGEVEAFGINRVAHEQLSDKLQIPRKYYDRMKDEEPELLVNNINTWLRRSPKRQLLRTLDGDVRAFLSDRYGIMYDNALALRAAMPVLMEFPEMTYKSLELTDRKMYLQCVLPSMRSEVKVGEAVNAGIVISNSEVGFGRFTVERLIYLLSCTNGMIRGESIGKTHLSSKLDDNMEDFYKRDTIVAKIEAFRKEVRDHVSNAFDERSFMEDIVMIRKTTERKIGTGKIEGSVKKISKKFSFVQTEQDDILHRLIEGGDLSQFGISQAVTNLANATVDYDRVVELERAGGNIIDLSESEWQAIAA